jgi:DNA invertase Pin-like site-specific DNA recombinase
VLKRLEAGDVLVMIRLDRLARSTRDLLNILDTIGKAGAGFKSLGDAWADTTTRNGHPACCGWPLEGSFILIGFAEDERLHQYTSGRDLI